MRLFGTILAFSVAACAAGRAHAAVEFTFNSNNPAGEQDSLTFTSDGVSLTATGFAGSGGSNGTQVKLYQESWGLGVLDADPNGPTQSHPYLYNIIGGDSTSVDGLGGPQFVRFESPGNFIRPKSIVFAKAGTNDFDDFELFIDGVSQGVFNIADNDENDSGLVLLDNLGTFPFGTQIDIVAIGDDDDFLIEKLDLDVDPIPEPGTACIWLGLGACGFLYRRRKMKKAA